MWVVLAALVAAGAGVSDTVFVLPATDEVGDGSAQRPFRTLAQAVSAGLRQPPSATTWTIVLREGTYRGPGQVEVDIRDTKRFIIFFENRGVDILCERADYWLDFTGLGGRGSLEITGNGGSVQECQDSAVRSRRKTYVSGVRFLGNRALLRGGALRVRALDRAVDVDVEDCTFEDQLQRPVEPPSAADNQGGGAVWVGGAATLRISSSVFRGNEGSSGGGLLVTDCAQVALDGCLFERNRALLGWPGGGGAVIRTDGSQATTLRIQQCAFDANESGGSAGGLWVGGSASVHVTLTQALFRNNTSRDEGALGIGLLLWGEVRGHAYNSSFIGNVDSLAALSNMACAGPPLGNECSLAWDAPGCDLCAVRVSGREVPTGTQICHWPSLFVWRRETVLVTMILSLLGFLVVAALAITFMVWYLRRRRRRRHRKGFSEIDESAESEAGQTETKLLTDASGGDVPMHVFRGGGGRRVGGAMMSSDFEIEPMEDIQAGDDSAGDHSVSGGNGAVAVSDGGGVGSADGATVGADDLVIVDDRVMMMMMEPPGYGGHSSNELLPSQDFVRASPMAAGRGDSTFKEIQYEELDLDAEPIGSGAFGLVYRAFWRGSVVAVKKYIGALSERGVADFRAEAQLLHAAGNHPNVIKLFGACTKGPNFCLVLPYYPRGSVRQYFSTLSKDKLTWAFVGGIALQITAGMMHLHREGIVHRDLAARNILMDDSDRVRITDFGLARFLLHASTGGKTASNVGAVAWMSPEAVAERRYSKKSDVWSFGVVLWELCTGQLPYQDMEPIHAAVAISKGATLPIPDYIPEQLAAVMLQCWAREPSQRPVFEDVFKQLRKDYG